MTTTHDTIEFVCGDTWTLSGLLQDADGQPLSLASAAISWKLDSVDGFDNALTLAIGSGITIADQNTAAIWIEATPTQTLTVPPGTYYDWLRITLSSGKVFTEWTGVIKVVANPK